MATTPVLRNESTSYLVSLNQLTSPNSSRSRPVPPVPPPKNGSYHYQHPPPENGSHHQPPALPSPPPQSHEIVVNEHRAFYPRPDPVVLNAGIQLTAENHQTLAACPFPARVLDIGCRSGELTRQLAYYSNVGEVYAIDTQLENLAMAECFNDNDKIRYGLATIDDQLSWPLDKTFANFDIAFAFGSLDAVANVKTALQNVASLLKPRGYFIGFMVQESPVSIASIIGMIKANKRWKHLAPTEEALAAIRNSTSSFMRSTWNLDADFLAAGFKSCQFKDANLDIYYSDKQFKDYIVSKFSSVLYPLQDVEREAFLEAAFDLCAQARSKSFSVTAPISPATGAPSATARIIKETIGIVKFRAETQPTK